MNLRTSGSFPHWFGILQWKPQLLVFIRSSFDGIVWSLWYGVVRPSVHSFFHNFCRQYIARHMWPRMLKLTVYTSYGKKKYIYFQGHWAFIKNSGTWILVRRIKQELCSLGSLNLVCTVHMERGRSLLIFKVKGHISRSLGHYNEFWHLDPGGQDIARTMQPRLLKVRGPFVEKFCIVKDSYIGAM